MARVVEEIPRTSGCSAATPGGLGLLLDSHGDNHFHAQEKGAGFAEDGTGLGVLLHE